ncbi:hypothetical protein OIU35_31710 [Boseaceae bacterium BT-24-1]|nr:hypothetical protein [Boseaceae bacterium BT-24-1]
MTSAPDPFADLQTLPGGVFMAACIDAVEAVGALMRARERSAESRGQGIDREKLREAALLAGAAEMLTTLKAEGESATAYGRQAPAVIVKAVTVGKRAFQQIDRGIA